MSDPSGRRRVLFVCTANICRSPTAELLARHRFGESSLVYRSAGFLDPGRPCPQELVSVLDGQAVDATRHRSYRVDEASVRAADLILTMESSHLQELTAQWPDAFAKTLPLKEAAALAGQAGVAPAGPAELLDRLGRGRDPRQYLGYRWDVEDPYGRRMRAYRRAVAEIDDLVATVIGGFG